MRILVITRNFPPSIGGIQSMLYQIVRHLIPHVEVDVIGPFNKSSESLDLKVYRPGGRGIIRFIFHALNCGIRLTSLNDINIIVVGSAAEISVGYILSRLRKKPLVALVHGLDVIYANRIYQWYISRFLNSCERIIVNSHATKQECIKRGVEEYKIVVINPGIDFKEFVKEQAISKNLTFDFDKTDIILSVGRLVERKGVKEFITHVMPLLVRKYPEVTFIIVGLEPKKRHLLRRNLRSEINYEINRLGLNKHVFLLGEISRSELLYLYKKCKLFVLPVIPTKGDMEGFGIVLLEANAAGKPVVASRIGGIPDAVIDGKNGILVEAGDWEKFAGAVGQIISDNGFRNELGEYGRQRVRLEFDWSIVIKKYLKAMTQIYLDYQ